MKTIIDVLELEALDLVRLDCVSGGAEQGAAATSTTAGAWNPAKWFDRVRKVHWGIGAGDEGGGGGGMSRWLPNIGFFAMKGDSNYTNCLETVSGMDGAKPNDLAVCNAALPK
jgi:hypothetical protein